MAPIPTIRMISQMHFEIRYRLSTVSFNPIMLVTLSASCSAKVPRMEDLSSSYLQIVLTSTYPKFLCIVAVLIGESGLHGLV